MLLLDSVKGTHFRAGFSIELTPFSAKLAVFATPACTCRARRSGRQSIPVAVLALKCSIVGMRERLDISPVG